MIRWKNKKLQTGKVGKQLITNATAYVILIAAVGATAFFGVCSPNMNQHVSLSGYAAKVGNSEVTASEFKRVYQRMVYQYQQIYQDKFDPAQLGLAKNVLTDLVNQRVVYEQAKALGFAASKEEAEDVIYDQFKDESGKFNEEGFTNYLRGMGYSEATLVDEVRRNAVTERFRRFFSDSTFYATSFAAMDYRLADTKMDVEYLRFSPDNVKVSVTPEEVKAFAENKDNQKKIKDYYDRNSTEFNREKRVKASHILVAYKDSRNAAGEGLKRDKAAAKAQAQKVLAEAKKPGANFANLAKTYTDEASGKTKGGDLGYFTKNDMVKEFSDVAFAMKAGQVSDVVESPFGFHIIRVTEVQEASSKDLAAATNDIAQKLLEQGKKPEVLARRAERVLDELKQGGNTQKLLTEYGIAWKTTGDFSPDARSIPGLGSDDAVLNAIFAMHKAGDVAPNVLSVDGATIVMRLKKRQDPDMSKLDTKKSEELMRSAEYAYGGALYRNLTSSFEEKLKKAGKINMNKEFLAVDQRNRPSGG